MVRLKIAENALYDLKIEVVLARTVASGMEQQWHGDCRSKEFGVRGN